MRKAKVVQIKQPWHQSEVVGAHADFTSPFTPRQQSRYSGNLTQSGPVFGWRALAHDILALPLVIRDSLVAWMNRPFPKHRSF